MYVSSEDAIKLKLETLGYEFQFELGEYDYSWTIAQVYTKDRRIFYLLDSGCSCSSFGDGWSLDSVEGELYELTSLNQATELKDGLHGTSDADLVKFLDLGLR